MRLEIGKDLAGRFLQDLTFMVDELDHVLGETRRHYGRRQANRLATDEPVPKPGMVGGLCRANQGLVTTLDTASYDEADTPTVKEALYWIARATLGNVRERAHAPFRSSELVEHNYHGNLGGCR